MTSAAGRPVLTRRGVLAATGAVLLSACGRAENGAPGRAGDNTEPLVVGASLELTGPGAALGVLQERALRITVDTLNENGVRVGNSRSSIRLLVRDNASDPETAARDATELTNRDNVHALLGGTAAATSLAIVNVAERLRVPFISLAAADGIALPLSRRTFIFKLTPDSADVARRTARLITTEGLDRVVVLAAAGPHGDSGVGALTRALRAVELELIRVVRLPAGSVAFDDAAARTVADRPGAVVVWAGAPDAGAAARSLRRAGYRGPLFLEASAVAEETLSARNAAAVEGAFVVHPMSLGSSSLTNTTTASLERRDFVFRYIQRHGSFSGFAPYGSDALRLIANAARLADSRDRGRLRAYLESQPNEGIVGAYAFTPIRHGGMEPDSLGIFTVSQGMWTRIS